MQEICEIADSFSEPHSKAAAAVASTGNSDQDLEVHCNNCSATVSKMVNSYRSYKLSNKTRTFHSNVTSLSNNWFSVRIMVIMKLWLSLERTKNSWIYVQFNLELTN